MESKRRIILVDDEPHVLEGLKRVLHSMRSEWTMTFCTSGEEALSQMEAQPYEVIISDIRMPHMSGAELLREVKTRFPQTARLVLSGYSDKESTLQTVGITHQFLLKPCDPDVLKSTIANALSPNKSEIKEEVQIGLKSLSALPTLKTNFDALAAELKKPEPQLKHIVEIVENDVGLTTKLLHLVNSDFFGASQKVSKLPHAVRLLGVDVLKELIDRDDVFLIWSDREIKGFSLNAFNEQSRKVSSIARQIAETEGFDKLAVEEAAIAGLIFQAGRLALMTAFKDSYKEIINHAREQSVSLSDAEHQVLGVSSEKAGAYVFQLWGFPDGMLRAISAYRNPSEASMAVIDTLMIVHFAASLCSKGKGVEEFPPDIDSMATAGAAGKSSEWAKIVDSN